MVYKHRRVFPAHITIQRNSHTLYQTNKRVKFAVLVEPRLCVCVLTLFTQTLTANTRRTSASGRTNYYSWVEMNAAQSGGHAGGGGMGKKGSQMEVK